VHTYHEPTMTLLHNRLCESLITAKPEELDLITSVDVQKHNVLAVADSMSWDFDLKSMWLTPSRWTMMIRQYLDPEEFQAWLETVTTKIGTKGRGIAVMRTKLVKPRGGAATGHTNKETRRWGSCMLAISYKAKPTPQITLYSRTSYLGYIGALDLSVAWMVGRYLATAMGVPVESFKFVWMNEAIQWHNFKSLAYMLNNDDPELRKAFRRLLIKPEKKLKKAELQLLHGAPAINLSRKWLRKMMLSDSNGETYGDMTYNTYRRIRRRWHTEVLGYERAQEFEGWSYYKQGPKTGEKKEFFKAYQPLPNCLISGLDFRGIGLPLAGVKAMEFEGGFDDGEDDE
jgi:hypothetical protein